MAALNISIETYRDKVLGGWFGKAAGVTLGAPLRGSLVPGRLTFYNPPPGQPAASAALDFPLVWLHTLEECLPRVTPEDLAVAWLEHLDYPQDEFGYAALNLRRGLPPPASGAHSNYFRHSTGALIRADLWAMVAPGAPQVAASLAYNDAKLDHCEDGEWAAMFLAALGSAAFFLSDPLTLLTVGLAMIPRTCRTARAVKAGLAAAQRGAAWLEARETVQHEVGDSNYTDAAQNMGFFTIGLFFGLRDFGQSLCAAVNCGYDAEVVGGALGSVLGILYGRSGMPQAWMQPLADVYIPGAGLRDLDIPAALSEVAERTVAVGMRVVADRCPDVLIDTTGGASSAPQSAGPAAALSPPSAGITPFDGGDSASVPPLQTTVLPDFSGPTSAEAPPPDSSVQAAAPSAVLSPQPPAHDVEPTPPQAAPAPSVDGVGRQPVSRDVSPDTAPPAAPPSPAPARPDYSSAIAWADNTLVKPLLITPANALVTQVGPYTVTMDPGDYPVIAYGYPKPLAFTLVNDGDQPFAGRARLLAPAGWQITSPAVPRQFMAANGGILRLEFTLQAQEGRGFVDIANAVTLQLEPESGESATEAEFVLLGASCWWTTGPFANYDGEGFDRSYAPEDKPSLGESYLSRMQQPVGWEKRTFPEACLDLEAIFKRSSGVCYGQTIFRSRTGREARIVANTNSGVKMWLNGAPVLRRFYREVFRPQVGSGPWAVDVNLRAGDNNVMVKWVRGSEPYQFSLTVSDRLGRGLPDVGNVGW